MHLRSKHGILPILQGIWNERMRVQLDSRRGRRRWKIKLPRPWQAAGLHNVMSSQQAPAYRCVLPLTAVEALQLSLTTVNTAGRLSLFYKQWSIITNDPIVLSYIKGYKIPFLQRPTQLLIFVNILTQRRHIILVQLMVYRLSGPLPTVKLKVNVKYFFDTELKW